MKRINIFIHLLSILSLTLLSGCLLSVQGDYGGHVYDKPSVLASAHTSGPPSHAKANGYRHKNLYHYYPAADVYLDTGREVYFYLDSGGAWKMSVSLPQSLNIHLGEHVAFEMETDQPYSKHREHKKKYPPGKNKKKKKKKHG